MAPGGDAPHYVAVPPNYGAIPNKGGARGGSLAFHAMSVAALVVVPFLMFTVMVCTWAMLGYYHFWMALAVSLVCFMWTSMFMVVHVSTAQQGPMYLFLSILCLMAMQGGAYAGLSLQTNYFMPYSEYTSRPTYTDVTPVDPAASRSDGGIIGFTSNSVVDTLRGANVLSHKRTYYCVAPILDESQQSRAEFWAVGKNCCERHAGFYCDSSRDPKAKVGLVVLDTDSIFDQDDYSKYMEAVKIAAATDKVASPDVPVLVRWITDSDAEVHSYWSSGMINLAISLAIALAFFILAAAVLHSCSR